MAMLTYQTYLMCKSGNAYAKVCDIKTLPDLGGAPETAETTTLSDPVHTYIPGLRGVTGTLDFTANYTPTDYAAVLALDGAEKELAVWFGASTSDNVDTPDGSNGKFEFKGYVNVYVNGGGAGDVLEMTISVTPTTEIVKAST